jgi:hypothetical protein
MAEVPEEESPYERNELLRDPTFPPLRGLLCPHCRMRIPQFADISKHNLSRVLALLRQGRMIMAIQELRAATGSPLNFAHLWVAHRGRPIAPEGDSPTPCPYCGKPLQTALAKQCRHCRRDWHDPTKLATLGAQ